MENWQIPLIGPLAPVIGAIVGGLIGAFVTYRLVVKRKALAFRIGESEDLTLPLRRHHKFIAFKIGEKEMLNLNRSSVLVKNAGNISITNVTFSIVIEGAHSVALAEASGGTLDLRREIKIEQIEGTIDPVFNISLPYLNAKENFEIELFFDGVTSKCNVHCRIEDVNVKIQRGKTALEEALDFGGGDPQVAVAALTVELLKRMARMFLPFR
jgi:hypothetical protein